MSPTRSMDARLSASLVQNTWDFADLSVKLRFAQALERGSTLYPIYRELRFAARTDLESLFDALALLPGWSAHRARTGTMILDGEGVFVSAHGGRKSDYCSCSFAIWTDTVARADEVSAALLQSVEHSRIREPMFSIDWHFLTARGELESAAIEELANDVLHDAAYPEISGGVTAFIDRYLSSDETVLVLQGPPGTGKTRFIRAILGEMSRRKRGQAQALYTGDKKAMESDELFVRFITGWEDAFVVEDADHLLRPRAEGNEHLHRFLAIADGVVRAQGRKIIFSTNLPNVGDLDDALIRPGRCFARVALRELSAAEAGDLLETLCAGDAASLSQARTALTAAGRKSHSLAEVYKLARK